MSQSFRLLSSATVAVHRGDRYNQRHVVGALPYPSAKRPFGPKRCRLCGKMITNGEMALGFIINFTEWDRFRFTAWVHDEPCIPTR